ncbi:MAG: histidine--tRNA ligase [Cytophagales bacterium]|nr:histidine--tRNA ligase [Cytophagales bacterium]
MSQANKPSLPRGVRDFGTQQMAQREYVLNNIKNVFKKYGFLPIETPAMEQLSVLTGKYGDEGDQLIFKVLNSGNYLENIDLNMNDYKKLTPSISEKALRYDLTVPFARYVVMNRNELTFPFKRYQIQPVWRADRPQKGRYREFYQCDADVVGTNSLICEAEIVMMIAEVFALLRIDNYSIHINHRKILAGIAECIGVPGQESALCTAIDKLDKIGEQNVSNELIERGIPQSAVQKLFTIINIQGSENQKLTTLGQHLQHSAVGNHGIHEIAEIYENVQNYGTVLPQLVLTPSLARGLSYYTGAIFEVKVHDVQIGSVSGGGRYDNLTGLFGLEGYSGVGISFGVDRLYDVMNELSLFNNIHTYNVQVMLTHFDEISKKYSLKILQALRQANIAAEIYPDADKIKKQFGYADAKNIPYVLIIGDNEIKEQKYTLKNMLNGEQKLLSLDMIIQELHAHK